MPDPFPSAAPNPQPSALLRRLLADPNPPPFAVLRRADGPGVEVLVGEVVDAPDLARLPLPEPAPGALPVLALVPFRQVRERGFHCRDDGTPLRCLLVRSREVLTSEQALDELPATEVAVRDAAFDLDDDAYAEVVKRVVGQEIGRGEGANFVIRRDLTARLTGPHAQAPARAALELFRRLLRDESGAYWTFVVHTPELTLVGATPERHVSVVGGEVVMNPISGTYRYPEGGPTREDLLRFLADRKETEELYMVVDEELKQMSAVCERGGRVRGPFLKQMGHLAHTEYLLTGSTRCDVREVLTQTLFAATVTGSPVENACSVIARHEATGRGYYAGTAALLERDADGEVCLDSPILIRTAALRPDGSVRLSVGATLVRHSVPENEVAETHVKARGVLAALGLGTGAGIGPNASVGTGRGTGAGTGLDAGPGTVRGGARAAAAPHPRLDVLDGVASALAVRNDTLARFWLDPQDDRPLPGLAGRSALVVDAEDAWTTMLAHMLRRLGMIVTVRRWDDPELPGQQGPSVDGPRAGVLDADAIGVDGTGMARSSVDGTDLLVCGPGPGDPREPDDPRMARLRALLTHRVRARRPLLAVCLSHQVLAGLLGLPVRPLPASQQGTQRVVPAFGREARVGFYNSFAAWLPVGSASAASTRAGVLRDALPGTVMRDGAGPRELLTGVPLPGEVVVSPDEVRRSALADAAEVFRITASVDPATGEVFTLRGPAFASTQFHLESVLSTDGVRILGDVAAALFAGEGNGGGCGPGAGNGASGARSVEAGS